ncbi:MAG: DUF169 domain-containing protein [Candidatus Omnitrophica bacterium]|nr:DUF169 domain-containing protein [Candidatus Omnitrophota bacterium]
MRENKIWQQYSALFKEILHLDYSPVAINCLRQPYLKDETQKIRICRAILDAAKGKTQEVGAKNNACFGASWHLGFQQIKDEKILKLIKQFVVEGEKLFCSSEALDNLIAQMEPPPDNSRSYFLLAPLEKSEFEPQLVIFVVNAEGACKLLTFVTFLDGNMPKIKIGGPTCRLSIIYPLVKNEVNISFYDHTARKMCNLEKDKLLVSVPYAKIPQIVEAIDKCSAGRAKVEYPQQFREFLQKRLTGQKKENG